MGKGKKILIAALLALSILLINSVQADLFAPASQSGNSCSSHGDVKLELRTINALSLKEVLVKARHSSEPSYYEIQGTWRDKDDYSVSSLYSDMNVMFRSSDSYFKKTGEYSIRIEYKDEYEDITFECPQFTFSCNDIDIEINQCYSEEDNFVIEFLGKGLETQRTVLDLEKDLEYNIKSKKQIWGFGSLPKNVSFVRLENENYRMIFPRNKNYYPANTNLLESVEIRVKEDFGIGVGSGCSRENGYRVYPDIRGTENECPTKILLTEDKIKYEEVNDTEDIGIKPEETRESADITGKAISEEDKIKGNLSASILISIIIGFVIGTIITFLLMNKKK